MDSIKNDQHRPETTVQLPQSTHVVYLLECVNGSYYTGYTTDLDRRYREHQKGTAKCRYTRSFPPKRVAAFWEFRTLSDALAVERHIKALPKAEKHALVLEWNHSKSDSYEPSSLA